MDGPDSNEATRNVAAARLGVGSLDPTEGETMYARVVRFEGSTPEAADAMVQEINSADGPPEGVKATTIRMLADRGSGTIYVVTYYETEDDMKAADAVFNEMSPPDDSGVGQRAAVNMCELLVDRDA